MTHDFAKLDNGSIQPLSHNPSSSAHVLGFSAGAGAWRLTKMPNVEFAVVAAVK